MLGSMVLDYLSTKDLDITAPTREEFPALDYSGYDYIINCIGVIKQKLTSPLEAIEANSLIPHDISEGAPKAKIIQIATDCVFSGRIGRYEEGDEHDASDIYGRSKSLGEVDAKNFYNIRTSIIGPDRKSKVSLFEWFMSQKKEVNGYVYHDWNGITTLHFAKLCCAIIEKKRKIPNLLHFVPGDVVSKYDLLKIFVKRFDRDIKIKESGDEFCDRSLETIHEDVVKGLWKDMGYNAPPTIDEMVEELAEYIKKRKFYGKTL